MVRDKKGIETEKNTDSNMLFCAPDELKGSFSVHLIISPEIVLLVFDVDSRFSFISKAADVIPYL